MRKSGDKWERPLTSTSRLHDVTHVMNDTRPSPFFAALPHHVLLSTQTEEQKAGTRLIKLIQQLSSEGVLSVHAPNFYGNQLTMNVFKVLESSTLDKLQGDELRHTRESDASIQLLAECTVLSTLYSNSV